MEPEPEPEPAPQELSLSELREMTVEALRDGIDPTVTHEHEDCPHCGEHIGQVPEEQGPSVEGFAESLAKVQDLFGGHWTEADFRDIAEQAWEEALEDLMEEKGAEMTREQHESLDSFEDIEP